MLFVISITLLSLFGAFRSASSTFTILTRNSLNDYDLALCADGSKATYYTEKRSKGPPAKDFMILLGDSPKGCLTSDECAKECRLFPDRCRSSRDQAVKMKDGLWSTSKADNPMADFFKVYIPSCSLDEFSGTRGRDESGLYFHGRHIFSSVLRHLVTFYDLHKARNIVLVGSGISGAAVGRTCDFLHDAVATVNGDVDVRCVVDGSPDFNPTWLGGQVPDCSSSVERDDDLEKTKFLWGRQDDESCVEALKDDLNSTALAAHCGSLSRWGGLKCRSLIAKILEYTIIF